MNAITRYWLKHYATQHCTLCGNSGVIDSRGRKTAAGVLAGRLNWCICPNGQALRKQMGTDIPSEELLRR
jgi:hypothetical protein